jgi:hypothetical protein
MVRRRVIQRTAKVARDAVNARSGQRHAIAIQRNSRHGILIMTTAINGTAIRPISTTVTSGGGFAHEVEIASENPQPHPEILP